MEEKMRTKILVLLMLLLIAFLLIAQSGRDNKTLKIGIESDLDGLTPWDYYTVLSGKILWNVFEPLVAIEEETTKIRPYLATSWDVSSDNRTWLVKLREGVKFHDGSILTADDVVASSRIFLGFGAKAEKVDQYSVRFNLPEPNSTFLSRMAQTGFTIAPAKTANSYQRLKRANRLSEFVPIGTGPFKFSHQDKGKEIVLESFSDYWQKAPKLDRLVYQIIPNNNARISALEKGEIDVVDVVFPADLPRLKSNQNIRVLSKYGMSVCFIAMNTTKKPLDNIKVRQALNFAIDKMRLARMFYYGGYGVPTNRVLSPAFWGFTALPRPGKYNPQGAKRLLAEVGYNDGLSLTLVRAPKARPDLPDPKGVAEEIKNELAKVDVNVNIIDPSSWNDFSSILKSGDFDLELSGWIEESGSPDYILSALLSDEVYSYNNARWRNELFDDKLKAARRLPPNDMQGRIRLYNEAQKIFQQEAPWIPLFHTKIFLVHSKKIKGVIFYPSSMISYHKVTIED
jgi:peptide/nickel transport system substrate-binding protein